MDIATVVVNEPKTIFIMLNSSKTWFKKIDTKDHLLFDFIS